MMLRKVFAFATVAAIAAACGGTSTLGTGDGNIETGGAGGKSGSSGTGGSGTGGSSGTGGAGYDPCAGKTCGTPCTLCDPKDATCVDDLILRYCGADGVCGGATPCPPPPSCVVDKDCPQMGMACQQCPDGTYACPTVQCINGQCIGSVQTCSGTVCASDADCPRVGAPCQICPDGSTACPSSQCVNGQCAYSFPGCTGYNPCAGKACGDQCTQCDPTDPACTETAVLKYCDASGACTSNTPVCGVGVCKVSADCPAVGACPACPGGQCATLDCINGACQFVCPPNPTPACTTVADCIFDTICISCWDGSCAKGDCINGECRQVCPPQAAQCRLDSDCPALGLCKLCPDSSCASTVCLNGQCQMVCPA